MLAQQDGIALANSVLTQLDIDEDEAWSCGLSCFEDALMFVDSHMTPALVNEVGTSPSFYIDLSFPSNLT